MNRILRNFCLLATLLAATFSRAQQDANLEQGLKPFGAYSGSDIESISLSNGNLILHIPIISYPQRGNLHLSFYLFNNDKNWEGYCAVQNPCHWAYKWRAGGPTIANDFRLGVITARMLIRNPDGSRTTLFSPWVGAPDGSSHRLGDTASMQRTLDGSGIAVPVNNPIPAPGTWTLIENNGTRHTSAGVIEDTNGNKMTVITGGWSDSLGRTIPSFASTTNLAGCPSGTLTATFASMPTFNGGTITFKTCSKSFNFSVAFPDGSGATPPGGVSMMTALLLPDGTQWSFAYDSTGSLSTLTLPTGGTITYTFSNGGFSGTFSRVVSARSVNANDGTGPHTSTYSYALANGIRTTTVVDGADNQHEHDFVAGNAQLETAARYYTGSGGSKVLLKTVATAYTPGQADPNFDGSAMLQLFPLTVTTTLGSKTSQTTTTYDNADGTGDTWSWTDYSTEPPCCTVTNPLTIGSVVKRTESDWSSSPYPPVRETLTNYLWQTDGTGTTKSNNLLNLVSSSLVCSPLESGETGPDCDNGTMKRRGETDYGYDQTSVASSGVTTQHNTPPTATKRGNQTTVSHWLAGTTFLSSTATYFDTGMVQTATDPGGHATTYAYDTTTLKGAYPTQVTGPSTAGGTVTHVSSSNYDFNTGLATSSTDENGQATTSSYDSSWRITQRNLPDGGQVNWAYTNAAPFKVTVTSKITATMNKVVEGEVDGLGRVKQTRLFEDAGAVVKVDTAYDNAGRVYSVSNPYRTGDTVYQTTTLYDGLGRAISVTAPDSSATTTGYTDNCVTVTDPASKSRKSCSDALGQLTGVWEDPAGANYETDYQYDSLGNLKRVDQKGGSANSADWRTRSFTYDALSRLLTAVNPESGTIAYVYDDDSNVTTKTSPQPNQTSSSAYQYIDYCYDELHRLTKKYYRTSGSRDCGAASPPVTYAYDQANGFSPAYPKPRRTGMTDASGSTIWNYDKTGQTVTEQRLIHGSTDITKTITYGYNLDGSLASLTYPSGRVVTYTYNSAGQAISGVDATNSLNFATVGTYAAQGALSSVKFGVTGSFTGIVASTSFNSRLQPSLIQAQAPSQTVLSLTYAYGTGGTNNGNVFQIQNNRDTNRSQNFTYDALNRIATAYSGGALWGEHFDIDAWGNLQDPRLPDR